jgi:hypothetical protein
VQRPSGPLNSAPADLAVAGTAAFGLLAWSQRALPLRVPFVVPVALLLLGGVAGAMSGPVPLAGLVAVLQDLPLVVMCAVGASAMADDEVRRRVVRAWALSAIVWAAILIVAVLAGVSALSGVREEYGGRASLLLGDPNAAANYLTLSVFVICAARRPRARPARTLALLVVLIAIFMTGSNGAMTALLCGTIVATTAHLALRFRLHAGGALAVALAGAVVLAAALPIGGAVSALTAKASTSSHAFLRDSIGRATQSTGTRTELFTEAVRLYLDGGVVGEGPASTKTRLQQTQAPYAKEAHSDYTASLIERGVIGLAAVLLLAASAAARVWTALQPRRGVVAPGRRAAAVGVPALLGGVVALFISAAFYEVLHFRQGWLFLAVIGSLTVRAWTPGRRGAREPG